MDTLLQIRKPVESAFREYEQLFDDSLRSNNPLLQQVLTYVSAKRGKQLRPLLVLLAANICNGVTDKTLRTAVALELLHTASLMHDDVVDASPTRRGMESVNHHWNNKVAVLGGDYMLSRTISLIADIRNSRILEIVSLLGRSLASGELLQLHANETMWISEEKYYQVIEQKTAKLFEACMEAGAESAGCTMRQRNALKEYGRLFGLCFQIKDDIFDYSDSEELGKPTMSDIQDGKVTLPLIIALQRAPQEESTHIRFLAEALSNHDEHVNISKAEQEIKSFVMCYQGVQYANNQMYSLKKKAVEQLSVFRDSATKESLLLLFDYAINRLH